MTSLFSQSLMVAILLVATHQLNAQCPTEAILEDLSTKTIPTDGSCDPPDVGLSCPLTTANTFDLDGTLTILSCATLDLSDDNNMEIIGNVIIEEGATLIVDRSLVVRGGSVTVNGTLTIGDGAGTDNLRIVAGGAMTVGTNGVVDVNNGFVRLGSNG